MWQNAPKTVILNCFFYEEEKYENCETRIRKSARDVRPTHYFIEFFLGLVVVAFVAQSHFSRHGRSRLGRSRLGGSGLVVPASVDVLFQNITAAAPEPACQVATWTSVRTTTSNFKCSRLEKIYT
jgi:hypothetical protein